MVKSNIRGKLIIIAALLLSTINHQPSTSYAALQQLTGKGQLTAEEYLYNAKKAKEMGELLIAEDYCNRLIANYPNTKYALEAKKLLKAIERKRRGGLIWLGN